MENLTLGEFASAIAFIVALSGGIGAIVGWVISPIKKRDDQNKALELRVKKNEEHLDADNVRLNQLESDTKQILLSVDVLLQHSIDGNNTEALRQRKRELNSYLINR